MSTFSTSSRDRSPDDGGEGGGESHQVPTTTASAYATSPQPHGNRAFGGFASKRTLASPNSRQSHSRPRKSLWESNPIRNLRRSSGSSGFILGGSKSGQRQAHSNEHDRFPRSYTAAVDQFPDASPHTWAETRSAKSMSFHPGSTSAPRRPHPADLERQSLAVRGNLATSGYDEDSVSYSYTATSDSIRDSTAMLAGMAVRSDDEQSDTRIVEEDEEGDGTNAMTQHGWPQLSAPIVSGPSTSYPRSYGSAGPSNLARALETTELSSPSAESKTIRPPRESTPRTEEPNETTTLLPRSRRHSGRREEVDGEPSHAAQDSAFSVMSSQAERGQVRSSYGYGALAQASIEAETGVSSRTDALRHLEPPESAIVDEDEETSPPLDAKWALVPRWLRPDSGRRPVEAWSPSWSSSISNARNSIRKLTLRDVADACAEPIRLLPATVLGVLMNILDGVSYGLIIFPSYPLFADMGGETGVSLFFISCIVGQLTFSLGGSIFKGGNGSMMIEVVPFYHILCTIIIDTIGQDDAPAVIATTMVAFALSSIFTGLAFLLLGLCRLGVLIGFFPRHILVGCIGGVGVFLLETGFEVAGRLEGDKGFQYNWETLEHLFHSWHVIALWGTPLLLAVLLRILTTKVHHPLVMPTYFIAITPIFYLIAVAIFGKSVKDLQLEGWIFDIGSAGKAPFYNYLSYFDFTRISWQALWNTMPTMISLTFFSVLHVPLNIPALAVSLKEDNVNVDRELTGHGISNLISGALGSVPNYLCFSNTLLFYRVGGGSRLSGLMLAAVTGVILVMGPGLINYLNVSTVGALIFLLGIDLCKEALWDTIGTVNAWEYLTIWFIVVVMSLADFVIGILAGICLACLFLTIQMSRRKTVRACFDGSVARSTVRRPMVQRKFLESVGTQTQILKLQGFLFFATINSVEALIRRALEIAAWQSKPMRFLVIDFSLVSGIDFSAAEAFTRVQRLLQAKDVILVFCGLPADGEVGLALQSVGLWADCGIKLEAFGSLNEALEWTENSYIRGMYTSTLAAGKQFKQASLGAHGALSVPDGKRAPAFNLDEAFENSPRRLHLHEAAQKAISKGTSNEPGQRFVPEVAVDTQNEAQTLQWTDRPRDRRKSSVSRSRGEQPLPLLQVTFGAYASHEMDEAFFARLCKYFKREEVTRAEYVWSLGDSPDGVYLIEKGALKALYDFESKNFEINEAMLAGTVAGELSFLSRQARDTSARAELDSVLWKLDTESMTRLEKDEPETFALLVSLLVRVAVDEQSSLMGYLVSRLS